MSSSSSFPRSSRLPGDDTLTPSASTISRETDPAAPHPDTTTTTTVIPFPTSSSPPRQPGAFFSGGASPPLIAGFISIGAFAVAVIAICAWCKVMRRRPAGVSDFLDRFLPARFRRRRPEGQFEVEEGGAGGAGGQGQGQIQDGQGHVHRRGRRRWRHGRGHHQHGRPNELGKAKPEMFDAWIERGQQRAVDDTPKWEAAESVPLSATLFTTGPPGPVETAGPCMGMAEVSSGAGRDSVEEEDEEKKRCLSVQQMRQTATGSSTLQVAVLLQMPSPPQSPTVTEALQNDTSVRGELAIGLVEGPWTREHPSSSSREASSREGEETTTS